MSANTIDVLIIIGIVFISIFAYGLLTGITWAMLPQDFRENDEIEPLQYICAIVLPVTLGILACRWATRPRMPRATLYREGKKQ